MVFSLAWLHEQSFCQGLLMSVQAIWQFVHSSCKSLTSGVGTSFTLLLLFSSCFTFCVRDIACNLARSYISMHIASFCLLLKIDSTNIFIYLFSLTALLFSLVSLFCKAGQRSVWKTKIESFLYCPPVLLSHLYKSEKACYD